MMLCSVASVSNSLQYLHLSKGLHFLVYTIGTISPFRGIFPIILEGEMADNNGYPGKLMAFAQCKTNFMS